MLSNGHLDRYQPSEISPKTNKKHTLTHKLEVSMAMSLIRARARLYLGDLRDAESSYIKEARLELL